MRVIVKLAGVSSQSPGTTSNSAFAPQRSHFVVSLFATIDIHFYRAGPIFRRCILFRSCRWLVSQLVDGGGSDDLEMIRDPVSAIADDGRCIVREPRVVRVRAL